MANPEHLQILSKGVRIWNKWREEYSEIVPNLSGSVLMGRVLNGMNLSYAKLYSSDLRWAYLEGANLTRATLSKANLFRARLKSADLRGAILTEADLSEAHLRSANLKGANLIQSNLIKADLTDANLEDANLYLASILYAILERTNLRYTSFNYASIGWTKFIDTNLAEASHLDTVSHRYSSTIDVDTLYRVQGNIPAQFLQAAGLPEPLITYLPSLHSSLIPVKFHSCFISFSSKDSVFAEKLHVDLLKKGVVCWFAPKDMKIGDKIRTRIDQSIHYNDKLLLILTEDSVVSHWVEQEVETALAKEREQGRIVLFPIRLDDTIMQSSKGWPSLIKNTRHIGDFRNWGNPEIYQEAFGKLLRDLKAEE